ncbi:MAG: outer membrane protein [Desulforhopalus sp.]|jgi:outer membrane protein
MKKILHTWLFLGSIFAFLLVLGGVAMAQEVQVEEDLSYKIWENDFLYPSLSHYLKAAEASYDTADTAKEVGEKDSFLKGILESYTDDAPAELSPEIVELNLRQAMQVALSQNREVQLALLAPAVAESELQISKTVYDPTLFSDARYYDSERPIQSLLDTGSDGTDGADSLKEDGWFSQTGVRQPLPTGGDATFSYEADNLENNSELTIPNPQYTSRFKLELRQSLLQGFGDIQNKSEIDLASIARDQSQAQYRKDLADVLQDLTAYYWRYSYYYQLEQISRVAIAGAEEVLGRIETRNEQGIANLLDLDRARSSVEDRRLKHFGDKKLVQTTLDQLKELLGIAPLSPYYHSTLIPTEPFLDTFTLPGIKLVQTTALTNREEISIARQELQSAATKLKLAEHLELPTLDARTSYTLNGLGEEYGDSVDGSLTEGRDSWDAGLFLEWQIGGRKSSLETKKALLGAQKAKIAYKRSIESIIYEVRSIHNEASLTMGEVQAAERSKQAYGAVVKRESALYDISRIDNQRLLDSQDEYFEAERAYLKAVLNLNLLALKLQWVQGVFLETFGIES